MQKTNWTKSDASIIVLAPMDGYTDSAFRRICKNVNSNIVVFTEFTSADGIHHSAKRLLQKLQFEQEEKPIVAQIFGKNTETFVSAAQFCEKLGFDGIDLNMGCPSKKVVRSEHGVALRKNPEKAFQLVQAITEATSLPVSVKTRLGWENANDLVEFSQGVEAAGAQLITIHGRTYKQGFSDYADFEPLYQLKKKLKIPILANGDILTIQDGMAKLKNLDGFMIGRASIGNPWCFSKKQITNFADKTPLIKKHAEYLIQSKGEKAATLEIRKHLVAYVKNLPNAARFRAKLVRVESLAKIYDILNYITLQLTE